MTSLNPLRFDPARCATEVEEYVRLLAERDELTESGDVRPFFRSHLQLAAALSWLAARMPKPDLIAFEFDLFGQFVCDLVVGSSRVRRFCLIEFEDGRHNSLFRHRSRLAPEWSPRFEHGYSQLMDWFWLLRDQAGSQSMEALFGSRDITYDGILVVGRDRFLGPTERQRLEWRREHVVVESKRILCVTFDELAQDVADKLREIELYARSGAEDALDG